MSHQQLIDQWVDKMLNAEARLHGLQLDLVDLRADGPHGQRTPARTHLTLCRQARQAARQASSNIQSLYTGGAI
ncbi:MULTISPECIES: hypothetical protein [Aeromonas]|uniref:hypothetical protein n=1 Tax=Aeromonas TaxID=642 RepID=UPI000344D719|nr:MULTISPECIES: hypothetical protein [Aeromonas]KMK98549.1 hypothetical protein VL01_01565 [Aeromonas enteropelogenes]MBW3732745.1 hypothetical protein [Aeromonas dhakensis]QSR57391.1 hypothetical protein GO601_19220 [Aeromonas dhakensis]WAF73319.1 hypothetical protein NRK99_03255 [Aeromonas dhakensis]WGY33746.1 hypothetical protein QK281_08010 [Aeromonas hydrophila]